MMNSKNKYDIKEFCTVPPKYGGVTVAVDRLIRKLTEDGYKVGGFYGIENNDESIHKSDLFDYDEGLSTRLFFVRFPKYARIVLKYKVIHSHYSLRHMIYMWSFLFFFRKKLVVTVHDAMFRAFYEQKDDIINKFFLRLVAKNKSVTWIAVSEQAKQEMLKLPFRFTSFINVIPAYIPEIRTDFKPLSIELNDYLELHDKIIVFYAHSFMQYNGKDVYGIVTAIRLFAKIVVNSGSHSGFVFCLSENNDEEQMLKIHEIAKSYGVNDCIFWQNGSLDSMYPLWKKADVYVRPTITDGDAVAVREALDMGVQVVASNVCDRPDKCITYEFGNDDELYQKTLYALTKGRNVEHKDFSNYFKIKEIYQNLL